MQTRIMAHPIKE